MTPKEAIEVWDNSCGFNEIDCGYAEHPGEMMDAISVAFRELRRSVKLEQEPCDAVSRKAAIDACLKGLNRKEMVANIKALPPVTPAENPNKWIPVSERLPDNDCECWVTVTIGGGMRNIVHSCNYTSDLYDLDEYAFENRKGESGFYNYDSEYGYYEIDDVIAWMPYFEPKPYKIESEVEKWI